MVVNGNMECVWIICSLVIVKIELFLTQAYTLGIWFLIFFFFFFFCHWLFLGPCENKIKHSRRQLHLSLWEMTTAFRIMRQAFLMDHGNAHFLLLPSMHTLNSFFFERVETLIMVDSVSAIPRRQVISQSRCRSVTQPFCTGGERFSLWSSEVELYLHPQCVMNKRYLLYHCFVTYKKKNKKGKGKEKSINRVTKNSWFPHLLDRLE